MDMDHKTQGASNPEKLNIDHHTAHTATRLHTKHQQIIYQHLPLGIVETNVSGRYIDVNEEFCRMLGYEREQLLQRSIRDVTHEEDYHIDIKLHAQLIAGEIPPR